MVLILNVTVRTILVTVFFPVLGTAERVGAQDQAQPVANAPMFENVIIARNDSHENGTFLNYVRGLHQELELWCLIRTAYGAGPEIIGGPQWMNVDRFNIEATGDVGNSPALPVAHGGEPSRLQLMMQSLLADQFKLVVHQDRREADRYALKVSNGDGRLGACLTLFGMSIVWLWRWRRDKERHRRERRRAATICLEMPARL